MLRCRLVLVATRNTSIAIDFFLKKSSFLLYFVSLCSKKCGPRSDSFLKKYGIYPVAAQHIYENPDLAVSNFMEKIIGLKSD